MKTKPLYIILITIFSAVALVACLYFSDDYMGIDSPYDTEILIVQPNNHLANQKTASKRSASTRYWTGSSQDKSFLSGSTDLLGTDIKSSTGKISISRSMLSVNNSGINSYTKQRLSEQESGSLILSSASNLYSSKQNSSSDNSFLQSAAMSINNAYAAKRSPFSTPPIGVDPDNPGDEDMGNPLPITDGIWMLAGLALVYRRAKIYF